MSAPKYELEELMIDIAARTYLKADGRIPPDEALIRTMDYLGFSHQGLVLSFGGLRKYAQMWQAVYDRAQGLPENGGQDTLDKAA